MSFLWYFKRTIIQYEPDREGMCRDDNSLTLLTKNEDGEEETKIFKLTDLAYVKRLSRAQALIAHAQIRPPSGTIHKLPASVVGDSNAEIKSPPRKRSKKVPVASVDIDPLMLMREMTLKEKSSVFEKAQEDFQADGDKSFFFFQCLDLTDAEGKNVNSKTGCMR
jgi:hypothetical protein